MPNFICKLCITLKIIPTFGLKDVEAVFIHTLNIHISVPVKPRARPKTGQWVFSSKLGGDNPCSIASYSFLCM